MPAQGDGVYDRWHLTEYPEGARVCAEHGLVPSASHGIRARYLVRYRDAAGVQRNVSVPEKARNGRPGGIQYARSLARSVLSAKEEGRRIGTVAARRRRNGPPTVAEYVPLFLAQSGLVPSTLATYENRLRLYVVSAPIGARPVDEVRHGEVREFLTGMLAGGVPHATVHGVRIALSSLFGAVWDADQYGLLINPVNGIRLVDPSPPSTVRLSWADIGALWQAIQPRYRVLLWLGCLEGLRAMEAAAVTVQAIRRDEGRIYVNGQHQGGEIIERLKTRASRGWVEAGTFLLDEADEHMRLYRRRPSAAELAKRQRRGFRPIPDSSWDLLVATRHWTPISRNNLVERFSEARRKAGLPAGLTYRHLRHHMDAVLIASGVEPRTVQARMRHARLDTTLNVYGYRMSDIDWEFAPASWTELYGIPAPPGLPAAALVPRSERPQVGVNSPPSAARS
ncbi:tyrosine-type recombinase/integrase [Streptomyces virginiae]|uniref:tyrosine-type recombinase/integrase n=1 Tax=Streptomyces virginiae TaxID=1961 RepID=UPI00341AB8B2